MFRLIVVAAILAAIAGAFDVGSAEPSASGWDVARTAFVAASELDARSFAMGFLAALVIATLQRFSHANRAAVRLERMSAWRRLLSLTILAAGLIAVVKYVKFDATSHVAVMKHSSGIVQRPDKRILAPARPRWGN